jgi:hypothetical protein
MTKQEAMQILCEHAEGFSRELDKTSMWFNGFRASNLDTEVPNLYQLGYISRVLFAFQNGDEDLNPFAGV